MTAESWAIIAVIILMLLGVALAVTAVLMTLDGRKHTAFMRRHGEQDTDEIPIGKVRVGLGGEEFGPSKPMPRRDRWR